MSRRLIPFTVLLNIIEKTIHIKSLLQKKLLFEGALSSLYLVKTGKLVDEMSFLKDKVVL